MAAYAERAFEDAGGSDMPEGSAREVRWNVFESTTFDEAAEIVKRDAPLTEGPLQRNGISSLERINNDTWRASVSYVPFVGGLPDPTQHPGARTASIQFECGGGRRMAYQNRVTYQVVTRPDADEVTPEEFGNLINGNEDGVQGTEIETSPLTFSVSKSFTPAELPPGYLQLLKDFRNSFNDTTVTLTADGLVMVFQRGELLFRSWSGGRSESDGLWKFTYNFASEDNLPAGTVIEGLDPFPYDVYGWSYLEVKAVQEMVGNPPVPVNKAKMAIEHGVYKARNHNLLGI
jgi:hypothetical protein